MSEFAVPKPIVPARLRTKKKTAKLTASSGPRFTWAQVAKHNTPEDCYVVVHGRVYDVTKYLNKHPGGRLLIMKSAGKDCTEDFEAMFHSPKARTILEALCVGLMQGASAQKPTSQFLDLSGGRGYPMKGSVPMSAYGGKRLAARSRGGARKAGPPKTISLSTTGVRKRKGTGGMSITLSAPTHGPSISLTPAQPSSSSSFSSSSSTTSSPSVSSLFQPYKLLSRTEVTPDTSRYVFSPGMEMPVGQHAVVRFEHKNETVKRQYTPISWSSSSVELLVKTYPNGVASQHINSLKPGDTLVMGGPFGDFTYRLATHKKYRGIVMLGSGTGITPLFQVLCHVCEDKNNPTWVHLLYGSRREEDILLGNELDQLAHSSSSNGSRVRVDHFLSQAEVAKEHWVDSGRNYWRGRINSQRISAAVLAFRSVNTDSLSTASQGVSEPSLTAALAAAAADAQDLDETVFHGPESSDSRPLVLICGSEQFSAQMKQVMLELGTREADVHVF